MIARINDQAFFGLPPQGLRPKGREERTFTELHSGVIARSHPPRRAHVEDYDANDDLYGVSDGDGDYMQVDLPYRSSPSQGPSTMTEPVHQPTKGSSTNTPSSSGKHVGQIPQTPSLSIAAENKEEIIRLQVRSLIEYFVSC